MVAIGNGLGRKTVAVLTNMNEPLGHEVGNANEVREAIEALKGKGSKDLLQVAVSIAAQMAVLGKAFSSLEEAKEAIMAKIADGTALETFVLLAKIQGGDPETIRHPERLPQAKLSIPVRATSSGYVHEIKAEEIGTAAMLLGAGRETKEDVIDYAAGISLEKKAGDPVKEGEVLCRLLTNRENYEEAYQKALEAYVISADVAKPIPFILDVIGE
jgi:pyrimidine-nucleoside phosphorylase/thymidine phosphorylase